MDKEKKLIMELRWDPVVGEWVMVSNIRSFRPWQPSNFCPFCPGAPETGYGWRALILENRFPMLSPTPPEPNKHSFYKTSKAQGRCFVVVETAEHNLDDLCDLSLNDIAYVLRLIIEKQEEVAKEDYATYFMWFRNKGKEIGVSLTHPHSQIYVTPFIPLKVEREIENAEMYWHNNGKCLFCAIMETEVKDNVRIVYSSENWVSFLPFYAHWPFEVHIYPKRHIQLLTQLTSNEVYDLAKTLKVVLCGLKILFSKPSPYLMVVHQAPLKGNYEYYHLHIEIYGMFRDEGKLKYAAGMETGGGNFTYDSVPEENALKLKEKVRVCSSAI
ncbi:MAG: galactose-1-phosphate uridylyltransferase [Ignisphaera sp.]